MTKTVNKNSIHECTLYTLSDALWQVLKTLRRRKDFNNLWGQVMKLTIRFRSIVLIVAHHLGCSSRRSHALSQWRLTFLWLGEAAHFTQRLCRVSRWLWTSLTCYLCSLFVSSARRCLGSGERTCRRFWFIIGCTDGTVRASTTIV